MQEVLKNLEQYKAIYLVLSYQERVGGFSRIVKEWQSHFNANIYLWNLRNPQFVQLNKYYDIKKAKPNQNKNFNNIDEWITKQNDLNYQINKFNKTNNLDFENPNKQTYNVFESSVQALTTIYNAEEEPLKGTTEIYIIENIDVLLIKGENEKKAIYETYLLEIVEKFRNKNGLYLVILGKDLLEWSYNSVIPQIALPLPTNEERRDIIGKYFKKNKYKIPENLKNESAAILGGLNKQEIQWIIENIELKITGEAFKQKLLDYKKQQLANLKLKFMPPPKISEIGGMEYLEEEIENVKAQFASQLTKMLNVPIPKGWVLAGSPGTGKSLAAKVVASRLNFPLILLSAEDLKAKGILNAIQLLKRCEKAAPCVLFIDELDKLFAKFENQDNKTKEVLGYLLTWLQEKTAPVFVIATLNRASEIPVEITRAGRFDEKFHTEYPTPINRYNIFRIHLKKYDFRYENSQVLSGDQWQNLINETERYTGAEIEQIVLVAVRKYIKDDYFDENKDNKNIIKISYENLLEARSKVVSVFSQNPDSIFNMENSLRGIFRPVGKKDSSIFAESHLPSWDN